MSWFRSAVSRAIEAGGNGNVSRVDRSYADTVVNQAGQAIVGGAKLLQDRNGARNFQNYKLAVKRLEELSVSCRGLERVQLLRRWLVALKEIERLNEAAKNEHLDKYNDCNEHPPKPNVIMYYDPNLGELNFREMFLCSQALEGITLNLILDEPSEEELTLLLHIFRLCLLGEKDAQDVTVDCVRALAKAFSAYDEVLAKREEILQYVQDAVAGLKVNTQIVRIDSELSNTQTKLDGMKNQLPFNDVGEKSSEKVHDMSTENLKESHEHFKLCSRLEELLLQKKQITNRHSPTAHNQKVDKIKTLIESLASSSVKAEKRISDNRLQKEETFKFRLAKTTEMGKLDKELTSEIKALQNRKDELEEELKMVTNTLTSANVRLHNVREERDQFDEASNQIIQHLNSREDGLSKSVALYRAETEVCNMFVNFLESTWIFQSSYANRKGKLVDDELERHDEYFVDWTIGFLSAQKKQMATSISSIRDIVENWKRLDGILTTDENGGEVNTRKILEEQYSIQITKLKTAFSIVDSIKKHFTQDEGSRNSNVEVNESLEAFEKIKSEFESSKRPRLKYEAPILIEDAPIIAKPRTPRLPFLSPRQSIVPSKKLDQIDLQSPSEKITSSGFIALPLVRSLSTKVDKASDAEVQWSKLKFELELDEGHSRRSSMDGNLDWEFDR
ncbi:hypothetical protein CASFOL_013340 [Castilleja foliolosa]|uniref:Uncharacterized protein n=1 Tax=Castilleja foliolosa TaxID=1961234 RepID=A0ABD3DJN9_9LAMI